LSRLLDRLFKKGGYTTSEQVAESSFRRMLKNSGYLFSNTGISAAASMLQGILAARLLGAAGFGILGTITVFTSVVNNFVSFRMGELVVKYVGLHTERDDPQSAAAVFKLAALFEMVASFFAFGLIVLLAPIGAQYLAKDPSAAPMFRLYGLVVLANLIAESSTGLLQIFDRFRRLAGLGIIQSMVTLAFISATFLLKGGLAGILFAYLIGKAIGAITISAAALIEARRRWGSGWWRVPIRRLDSADQEHPADKKHPVEIASSLAMTAGGARTDGGARTSVGELARFAVSTNLSATISLVTKDSELLWVSLLRGPAEAGYYKLALALANMVQMPIEPLPQATYPELSRHVANQRWSNFRQVLRQGSRLAGAYSVLTTLFLVLFGQLLIRVLYSPVFLPSYPALMILLAGLVVANTFYWRRVALLALGRADFPAKVNLILAIGKVSGTLAFVPKYGFLVSAALLSGFYWVGSLITVWKVRALVSQRELQAADKKHPGDSAQADADQDHPADQEHPGGA